VPGFAVRHSNAFVVRVPAGADKIVALAPLGDRLIIFTESQIYATHSRGDGASGSLDLEEPYLVSNGAGCASPAVVVRVPGGLIFWSAARNRLCALRDDLTVVPFDQVRHYTDTHSVTCGAYDPTREIAAFGTDGGGPTLVFHAAYGAWTAWTNVWTDVVDVCAQGGVLYFRQGTTASAWDKVMAEQATYEDTDYGTTEYGMVIETPWLSLAGHLGFQNCSRLIIGGQAIAAHTMGIDWAYDLVPRYRDSKTYATGGGGGGPEITRYWDIDKHFDMNAVAADDDQAYIIEAIPGRYRTTAIRARIQATVIGGMAANKAFSISSIALLVGPEPRPNIPLGDRRQVS
jgi:hypothetical protein